MERDPALRRFERDTMVGLALLTAGTYAVTLGRADVALGVAAGGALMGLSYSAIKGGVDALTETMVPGPDEERSPIDERSVSERVTVSAVDAAEPATYLARKQPRRSRRAQRAVVLVVVKFLGRYALLAVAAYVMLAHLRLHPAGLIIGVSAPFVAVVVQLVRFPRRSRRPRNHM